MKVGSFTQFLFDENSLSSNKSCVPASGPVVAKSR